MTPRMPQEATGEARGATNTRRRPTDTRNGFAGLTGPFRSMGGTVAAVSDRTEWTVTTKDGPVHLRSSRAELEPDVEGGALTFRDEDGALVHAYAAGWWRECHERGKR